MSEAKFVHGLLVSESPGKFYDMNILWEAKRPMSAEILRRVSLKEVVKYLELLGKYIVYLGARDKGSFNGQLNLGIAESTTK